MDNASQQLLAGKQVKYVAAFTPNRFRTFSSILDQKVNKPGEWSGLYNPSTGHSVVHCYSKDHNLGKKYVMSNACILTTRPKHSKEIPLFDIYKKTFNVCDQFNRKLHDRTWPHKKGGRNRLGEKGAQHDFIFTCILMNTFNAYWYGIGRGDNKPDFQTNCVMLSDELFMQTINS